MAMKAASTKGINTERSQYSEAAIATVVRTRRQRVLIRSSRTVGVMVVGSRPQTNSRRKENSESRIQEPLRPQGPQGGGWTHSGFWLLDSSPVLDSRADTWRLNL